MGMLFVPLQIFTPVHIMLSSSTVFSNQIHTLASTALTYCRMPSNFVNGHRLTMCSWLADGCIHRWFIWQGTICHLCQFTRYSCDLCGNNL